MLQVRSRNDFSDCLSSLKMIDYYVSMFVSRMIEKIWLWKALERIKAPRAATMIELVQIFSFSSCLMHNTISGSSKQSKFRKIHSYRNGEGSNGRGDSRALPKVRDKVSRVARLAN